MKKIIALIILALLLFTLPSAFSEEIYLDKSARIEDLYTESLAFFDDYFRLLVPKSWTGSSLSQKDRNNGIVAVMSEDIDDPPLKLTVSYFTPKECIDIFGGTGYDAIFADLSDSYDDASSVNINGIWTIAYTKFKDDHELSIFDIVCSDGYMYQIRFDIYDDDVGEIIDNIILSLDYV